MKVLDFVKFCGVSTDRACLRRGRSPDNEYLGCSHALAKGGAAQSQAPRQSKLSTGIDEPPTLRTGGSWGLFGVA